MHRGHTIAASVIGKPLAVGGTRGPAQRDGAGRASGASRRWPRRRDSTSSTARVAIQGFGRVGMTVAEELCRGRRVGSSASPTTATRSPIRRASPVARAIEWMREHDAIARAARHRAADQGRHLRPRLRHPRAGRPPGRGDRCERGLRSGPRSSPRWRMVGRRRPPTAILDDRGVTVIPDIICTRRRHGPRLLRVGPGHAGLLLDRDARSPTSWIGSWTRRWPSIQAMADPERVDLRSAGMMVAVSRVAEATTLRGLYP